jgi:hypothetical protein
MSNKITPGAFSALEKLAQDGDTYITNHPRLQNVSKTGVLLVSGETYHEDVSLEAFAALQDREFIREKAVPHYWFITTAGFRFLEKTANAS